MTLLLLAALLAPPVTAPAAKDAAGVADCRTERAQRCDGASCAAVEEGLHAEEFALDVASRTLSACLHTDCYTGPARLVRDPAAPWIVTAFAEVRSGRPAGGRPPPGGPPFPLTLTVDLRSGRFSAVHALAPEGLQANFGACRLVEARAR